jgi:hypothetical protein
MSSGWLTPAAPSSVSSSVVYPSISARAALTATSRPSASAMHMPIPAASKSERKRASLSRSASSARWRAVTSATCATIPHTLPPGSDTGW